MNAQQINTEVSAKAFSLLEEGKAYTASQLATLKIFAAQILAQEQIVQDLEVSLAFSRQSFAESKDSEDRGYGTALAGVILDLNVQIESLKTEASRI